LSHLLLSPHSAAISVVALHFVTLGAVCCRFFFSANLSRNHHQWLLGGFNLLRIWGNSGKTFAIQCACSFNSLSNSLNFFRSSFVNPSGCRFQRFPQVLAGEKNDIRFFRLAPAILSHTPKPKSQMVLILVQEFTG